MWQVFADHASSVQPIDVPRTLLWSLRRRFVYFSTAVSNLFKGTTDTVSMPCPLFHLIKSIHHLHGFGSSFLFHRNTLEYENILVCGWFGKLYVETGCLGAMTSSFSYVIQQICHRRKYSAASRKVRNELVQ